MKSLAKSELNLKSHTLKVNWNFVTAFITYTNKRGKSPQNTFNMGTILIPILTVNGLRRP
jgi:hypothetical protein